MSTVSDLCFLKNQHPVGEGGCSSGAVGLLQCLVGQHPDQPCCASPWGDLCSAAPQSQALHGGPALRYGQWHRAHGTWQYTTIQTSLVKILNDRTECPLTENKACTPDSSTDELNLLHFLPPKLQFSEAHVPMIWGNQPQFSVFIRFYQKCPNTIVE